jgi:hypothetical protein
MEIRANSQAVKVIRANEMASSIQLTEVKKYRTGMASIAVKGT